MARVVGPACCKPMKGLLSQKLRGPTPDVKLRGLCPDATINQYWQKGYLLAIPTHGENHHSIELSNA